MPCQKSKTPLHRRGIKWGPTFDCVLPQDVQQVLDLGPLLSEILAEIEKDNSKNHTGKLCNALD